VVLYNVTINIEEDAHDRWLEWMKKEHLPKVMSTGKFLRYSMYRLCSRQPDETGITYSVQYLAAEMADYEEYQKHHAALLQEETERSFSGKFVAFRSLLELEHEYEKA
jgi:hypothetical protein